MSSYLGVHKDERQLGDELAADGSQVQLHFGAVAHHDAECITLIRVKQSSKRFKIHSIVHKI